MAITRREFLRASVGAAAGIGCARTAGAVIPPPAAAAGDAVVVVVTLNGGNDGLNTVVPLRQFDRYRALRPTLALAEETLIPVPGYGGVFGLNPGLRGLTQLFARRSVAIINGCSTPPTAQGLFDHEASLINCWTGELHGTAPPRPPSGWLGRYLDGLDEAELPGGVDLGSTPLVLTGERTQPLSIAAIAGFGIYPSLDAEARYAAYDRIQAAESGLAAARHARDLRRQVRALTEAMAKISSAYRAAPGVTYPPTHLAAALQNCAALIIADRGVRALAVNLGGFDTHAAQNGALDGATPLHELLLILVSEAVAAFHDDLDGHGVGHRVVTLLVSEFGRRAAENAFQGTDHGLAGTMLAIGTPVSGGVYGDYPDLREESLVLGENLAQRVDFRSVYATVLARHLEADPVPILRGDFGQIRFL